MAKTVYPKHEVLNEKEAREVFELYKITAEDLPRIKTDDAALKDLEVKRGSVVKITRKSPTAGESTYYRVVID